MSVVSSRLSSVASILKNPGVRSQFVQQNRVYFKLPKNLRKILANFESAGDRKVYEDLLCILRDTEIKDSEFLDLLVELRKCTSLLGPVHKLLIEAILRLKWTHRPQELTDAYKAFIEDLVCVHIYHAKFIIEKLVDSFKPDPEAAEWEAGRCTDEDLTRLNHIHDILRKLLNTVPMSSKILLQALKSMYPYLVHGSHSHEVYVYALLQVVEYAPQLRSDILSLIISRLIVLDVNAPRLEIENCEDDDDDDDEDEDDEHLQEPMEGIDEDLDSNPNLARMETTETGDSRSTPGVTTATKRLKHPIAHTLDICMDQMLFHVHRECHKGTGGVLELESLKKMYFELLQAFEKIILPTHASHHVQFLLFYLCGLRGSVAEAFVNWLWRKVSNPNVAPVTRQSAVSYIASLLARASYVTPGLLKTTLSDISSWIHAYIAAQDCLECANSDIRVHTVFYSVCQAMFYVIALRHKDLVDTRKNLLFLQGLNLTKIVSCRLNPLRVCQPAVAQNFASVTRTYQLAYCYTVMEHNARSNLPIMEKRTQRLGSHWLLVDPIFPFDPYLLPRSGIRIAPLYCHTSSSATTRSRTNSSSFPGREENLHHDENMHLNLQPNQQLAGGDVDDFMDEMDKFSYSTSPGFM